MSDSFVNKIDRIGLNKGFIIKTQILGNREKTFVLNTTIASGKSDKRFIVYKTKDISNNYSNIIFLSRYFSSTTRNIINVTKDFIYTDKDIIFWGQERLDSSVFSIFISSSLTLFFCMAFFTPTPN